MQLQHPFGVVTSTVDGDVLSVLARVDSHFTVAQLQTLIPDRSPVGIRNSLARLSQQGIVTPHRVGRSLAFSLNPDHLAAEAIRQIASLKSALVARLHAEVSGWTILPVFGALFGSAARDEMRQDSDIDIFLVRPEDASDEAWSADVAQLAEDATRWTGNDARIIDVTDQDVLSTPLTPLFREIAEQGIVFAGEVDWLRRALREGTMNDSESSPNQ
ncbi:nucleotidyltransferase family protein [Microbacterium keratanolyticum]